MMRVITVLIASFGFAIFGMQGLHADIFVDFSVDDGVTFSDSFNVLVGESIEVGIYVRETDPDDVLRNDGLFGYGVQLERSNGGAEISEVATNPDFDFEDPNNEADESSIKWTASVFANDPPTNAAVLLLNVTFGSNVVGATEFQVGDQQPGTGSGDINWLSGLGEELDQRIFGNGAADQFSFSLNFTAIPEPSLLPFIVVFCGLVCRRGRKRK